MRGIGRILLVSLCGLLLSGQAARAEDALKLRIAFASPYSTYATPYLVAKELGWFKAAGLELDDLIINGDANATRAMVSGNADIAMTGQLNVFNADENGIILKWFGAWQPINDYEIVAPLSITSLSQLVGKTFAASGPSGSPQVLPMLIFRKLGLNTGSIKFISVGGHAARLQAVIAGKADATLVNEINAQIGVRSGAVHIIAPVQQYFPDIGYTILAIKAADIPKLRPALEALMRGSIRGARFAMEQPEKTADILHHFLPDIDTDLLADVIKRLDQQKVWGVDGGIDPKVVDFTAKLSYDQGETSKLYRYDQVVDTSIVDAVLKQEGRFRQ